MGNIIENQSFDEERALYGSRDILVRNCRFDGPADGESAFKECKGVTAEDCYYNLRYPFWHNSYLNIKGGEMTELCRASLWYVDHAKIKGLKMHGIKALRECSDIELEDCDIISPEFGWSVNNAAVTNTTAQSEYFFMRSENLTFRDVKFKGKYSFQYIRNSVFENCEFDTKDAFWHSSNVTVKNCYIKGEYLAWYADHLTLINCTIEGTQPLCYCKNLKLINCKMVNTDLSFEKSDVEAEVVSDVISIKNPLHGTIKVKSVGEIIMDDPDAKGQIVTE